MLLLGADTSSASACWQQVALQADPPTAPRQLLGCVCSCHWRIEGLPVPATTGAGAGANAGAMDSVTAFCTRCAVCATPFTASAAGTCSPCKRAQCAFNTASLVTFRPLQVFGFDFGSMHGLHSSTSLSVNVVKG